MATIRTAEAADRTAFNAVLEPLDAFTRAKGYEHRPETVTLVLENDGALEGGIVAEVLWDWMYIRLLSVSERLRGGGHGRRLVKALEAIAAEKGCAGVWVDTYTFQSPAFYQAMGYEEFGRLPDHPRGHARIFFRKVL